MSEDEEVFKDDDDDDIRPCLFSAGMATSVPSPVPPQPLTPAGAFLTVRETTSRRSTLSFPKVGGVCSLNFRPRLLHKEGQGSERRSRLAWRGTSGTVRITSRSRRPPRQASDPPQTEAEKRAPSTFNSFNIIRTLELFMFWRQT